MTFVVSTTSLTHSTWPSRSYWIVTFCKDQKLKDVVELIEANPNFAIIKFPDGRKSTVSVTDLASSPTREMETSEINPYVSSPTREAETSELNPYVKAQPQLTSDAPLNESQSSKLREFLCVFR